MSEVAARPVGAAGSAGAPPRKTPETTEFMPAVLVTVMLIVPPAATLIGALIQAPCEKSVLITAVRGPLPSLMLTFSRRPSASQSTT